MTNDVAAAFHASNDSWNNIADAMIAAIGDNSENGTILAVG